MAENYLGAEPTYPSSMVEVESEEHIYRSSDSSIIDVSKLIEYEIRTPFLFFGGIDAIYTQGRETAGSSKNNHGKGYIDYRKLRSFPPLPLHFQPGSISSLTYLRHRLVFEEKINLPGVRPFPPGVPVFHEFPSGGEGGNISF